MKLVAESVAICIGVLMLSAVLTWGAMTISRSYWKSACEADGYAVQSRGYGLNKLYLCVDPSTGEFVDASH